MMDNNDVSVAMLSHTGRLPQNPRMVKAMTAIRDTTLAAAEIVQRPPGRFGFWWVVDRLQLWCYQLRCTSS